MIELEKHSSDRPGSETTFGLFFGLVFLVYGAWPAIAHAPAPVRLWALWVSAAFLIVTLVRPRLLAPLNFLWFKLGMLLGAVVSPVVMGFLFVIVFLPAGMIMRARGHDLLRLKMDPDASTYWIDRDPEQDAQSSMKNQF